MSDPDLRNTVSLVRQAQAGDREALEALFTRYLPRVRQIVAVRLGQRMAKFAELEDFVQDALLRAFGSLESFEQRSDANFRNWLARCVENAIIDRRREEMAKKRGGGKVRRFRELGTDTLADSIFAGNDPTPSRQLAAREAEEEVEKALLTLPDHHRELIVLRHLCGMSYDEVAVEMSFKQEATARRACNRAVEKLRSALEE